MDKQSNLNNKHINVLAVDIGGTNCSMALVDLDNGITSATVMATWSCKTSDFNEPGDALDQGLKAMVQGEHALPSIVSIAAAGPVKNGRCAMTNAGWILEEKALGERLGLPVFLMNDFSALSYLIPHGEKIDWIPLVTVQDRPSEGNVRMVIGPGTGLGAGLSVSHDSGIITLPMEPGHAELPHLPPGHLNDYGHHIRIGHPDGHGVEEMLSGAGIGRLYDFYKMSKRAPKLVEAEKQLNTPLEDPAPWLSGLAREGHEEARAIFTDFFIIFARACSSLALVTLPTAGLYIAGGIFAKNYPLFDDWAFFRKHFTHSYRSNMSALLDTIPIKGITRYDSSLVGAAIGGLNALHAML